MPCELVVGIVTDDRAVADSAVEPPLSGLDAAVKAGCNVDQMVMEGDELPLKIGRVRCDVALAGADNKLLIAAQATEPSQRNNDSDQGEYCDCGGD